MGTGSRGQAMKEAVMSLSARDRQALDSIEDRLAGSDPGLASLLDTFARLEAVEEMPAREDIRAGGPPPAARAPGGTGAGTPRAPVPSCAERAWASGRPCPCCG